MLHVDDPAWAVRRTVIVLERAIDVYQATRVVHFDDEAMCDFQFAGLSREVGRVSEPLTEMEVKRAATGKPLRKSEIGLQERRYGHAGAWWFHQVTLEVQLRR